MTPFVRAEPTPTAKKTKVQLTSKSKSVISAPGETPSDASMPQDGSDDHNGDDDTVIHSHAWAGFTPAQLGYRLQLFNVIDFYFRSLLSDGVVFQPIHPPVLA